MRLAARLSSKLRAIVPEYDWFYVGFAIGAMAMILAADFARVLP